MYVYTCLASFICMYAYAVKPNFSASASSLYSLSEFMYFETEFVINNMLPGSSLFICMYFSIVFTALFLFSLLHTSANTHTHINTHAQCHPLVERHQTQWGQRSVTVKELNTYIYLYICKYVIFAAVVFLYVVALCNFV